MKKIKIAIAISGGVDSAAAAFLLKKQGYEVMGFFMRLGLDEDKSEAAARRVCQRLGIKFYPVNIEGKFKKEVIDYFLKSYKEGLTPNPCVRCNRFIKFGELLKRAGDMRADFLATGHYARKKQGSGGRFRLLAGKDGRKDQSYFLYALTQSQLAKIIFPLGDLTKEEVKKIALKEKLPFLAKESQDVCFMNVAGKILDHNEFLKKKIKMKKGPIVLLSPADKSGHREEKKIGVHAGLPAYTAGQRKGIEIGGIGPLYAAVRDFKKNILYVVKGHDDPLLKVREFFVAKPNWIAGAAPKASFACRVSIRYGQKPVPATVMIKNNKCLVSLKTPLRAVTSGQSAVFYCRSEVLGGGEIE